MTKVNIAIIHENCSCRHINPSLPSGLNCSAVSCSVTGPCWNGSPFCNSPLLPGLIVGDCKAHLLSRWKEKVSTSNGERPLMGFRRPLHEKVNCRTEPRNSACSTDYRADADCGKGDLSPVFASRAAEPHPASVHNLPYRAA